MYLERLLQINMATLAALGALLLGMGQRSEGPPLLVVVAAGLSVWLTDVTGKFRLGRWTANALMLIGAFVSLRNIYPPRSEVQTIGLSWFLIYLQIILLFQEKDQWKYWLLIMLSLLEVVMATLFSQGIGFGILLAVYMLLGLSAMTLLMLFRQMEHYRRRPQVAGTAPSVESQPPDSPARSRGTAAAARWPLSGQRAEFAGLISGSSHAGVGRGLFKRLGRMGMHTMALTLILFFALPRFGHVAWRKPITQPQPESLVGFTDKVKLGELGKTIESREEVMRVQFFRGENDSAPFALDGDVHLQGAYLLSYDNGQWDGSVASNELPGTSQLQRERRPPWDEVVRQKIRIEALDRNELFYVAPYLPTDSQYPDISINYTSERLQRSDSSQHQRFLYTLGTTAIVGKTQLGLVPAMEFEWKNRYVSPDDRRKLPSLVALADAWARESGLPKNDHCRLAQYLEHKLVLSSTFQYSMSGVERDPKIDPIEDFIRNHPQGNCEYFATALTLMLRSQGIPARMVSGFKCDRDAWNSAGGYYQVRQLHAHTWVEVYLRESELPEKMKHAEGYWSTEVRSRKQGSTEMRDWKQGGWLRLDPTPGGARSGNGGWFAPVRSGVDWLEGAWSRYVVELDCTTQRDAIYQPIVRAVQNTWRGLTGPDWLELLTVALYLDHLGREMKWVLLGLIGVLFLGVLSGIGFVLFRLGRRLWARRGGNHLSGRRRRSLDVPFYRRFEQLMAREGLTRAATQTQREFADAAGAHFASRTGDGRLAALPALVADAFYHVRFGRSPLDSRQTQAVEQALAKMAAIRKNRSL
jgi:protein-glutamine gamma-glutamyltransferase